MNSDAWRDRWDARFSDKAYVYGVKPNVFFKKQLDALSSGHILLGAEGEGRNAVYAACNGWATSAFDISQSGCDKAMQLAARHHVKVDYRVGSLPDLGFEPMSFDVVALIYAHFPVDVRGYYHRLLDGILKPGGMIILEAFGTQHLSYREANPAIGGPPEASLLISVEELVNDFKHYKVDLCHETEVELHQGIGHNGVGSVVRFVGRKTG